MKKYIVKGGKKLSGGVTISGAKNVALKAIVAACLTSEKIVIHNVPRIKDVFVMMDLVGWIGGKVELVDHTLTIEVAEIRNATIPLDIGAKTRASSLFLAPLLLRKKEAYIPNPGGCRIGARPIDRHIKGLETMKAHIKYDSEDGYFHASTEGLSGAEFTFEKKSHTGTETLLLAASLAKGTTVIKNAAEEPEVDDLIALLLSMGAHIRREGSDTLIIDGVEKLHGAEFTIPPDRNEVVTFAIASALTGGEIVIRNINLDQLSHFLKPFEDAGGMYEEKENGYRFFVKDILKSTDVITAPHPGFMTDWQAPWAVLMTQAEGVSTIHETVYESRFGYVKELRKMGAKISYIKPEVENLETFYQFNIQEVDKNAPHAISIKGKTPLHNAVLNISDLRAGATLILAALIAKGTSIIYGIEMVDRGYEEFAARLVNLGAEIKVVEELA